MFNSVTHSSLQPFLLNEMYSGGALSYSAITSRSRLAARYLRAGWCFDFG